MADYPENPQSRIEEFLHFLCSQNGDYPEYPLSRVEAYLKYLCENSGTGGDYDQLDNRPKINDVLLTGNKTSSDLGLSSKSVVDGVLTLIPSQATSQNKLADKEFVNSSIATNTAFFRGTYNSVAELQEYTGPKTPNDYAFVIEYDTVDPLQVKAYKRYKWSENAWRYEYTLNNSSFTAAQWAAINSGITQANVSRITELTDEYIEDIVEDSPALANKMNIPSKVTSGTTITLEDNTEYRLTNVSTLTLSYPTGNFECWLRITTASSGTITITLPTSQYIGTAPSFGTGETWELSIKDGYVVSNKVGS